jgi:protein O-mannosyl-transferase
MRRPATKSKPAPTSVTTPVLARPPLPVWLMAALLALVTIILYWPATGHDFVNYDDPLYVTDNPHVQAGLTWKGLAWAFGRVHGEGTYWHPLTWVSHMADCQVYGLKPWGHHLTSVLLHAANAVLVFFVFRGMTGAFWRCAVLAALFALHPLQVDSVAWVTERKNLLSAFFWLLTTWAYVRYVAVRGAKGEQGAEGRTRNTGPGIHRPSSIFYLLSLLLFGLGLMCKPVLVTLPFVLLLLDYWPLGRKAGGRRQKAETGMGHVESDATGAAQGQTMSWLRLVREKIPFFVLAAASSLITVMAHHALRMLDSVSKLPLDTRVENALVSYGRYLGKTFWPSRLAVFYPLPVAWPLWEVVTCGLLLLVISGLAFGTVRSRPWLLVGWFWFLGVLVPFSGLVQAGAQAMADRFMYVPAIGIFVAVIWGLHGLVTSGRYQRLLLSVAASAAIVLCLALTRQQLGYWQDSEALFRHELEVAADNDLAHYNLGTALGAKGQIDEAIRQLQTAIRLKPDHVNAHNNLGNALLVKGQINEAIRQFQEALRLKPDYADPHHNLGIGLDKKGQSDEAIRQYQEAIRLKPDYAEARNNLGSALLNKGQIDAAIREFQEAVRIKPEYADAHYNLGVGLHKKGRVDAAITQYQAAIRLNPDSAETHNNLGIALNQQGHTDEAVRQFQEALRLKPEYADARKNMDIVLAASAGSSKQPAAATNRQAGR